MGESLNLSFENLCYHVNVSSLLPKGQSTKQILKGISGEFRESELSVVIGPSGSGKSSLLDVLSGFKRENVSGSCSLNRARVSTNIVRKVSSYVMQDNKLHGYLTVYETMMFAANFKRRKDQEKQEKIEEILSSLGVSSDKMFTFVKHLSGGEQKRLSIALELLAEPSIMFLDEPTTGLDSSSSTQCIQLLKKLAQGGKTIVITIHSPSALLFEMFDHLYALADGCCIYQGCNKNLVPFLKELGLICPENFSPSDFLLEIATNDYGEQNQRLTASIRNGNNFGHRKASSLQTMNLDNTTDLKPPSSSTCLTLFPYQVLNLLHRNFLISKRDKMLVMMRLGIHLAIGLSFGWLYKNVGNEASKFLDNYRYIVATIVFQLYTSYFSLQTSIPLEFPMIKRERFNRWYSTGAFFTAFIVIDLPITFLCTLCYVSLTYVMTNQPHEVQRFLAFFCVSLALSYAAQGVGLMGSALLDVKSAAIFSGIFLSPFFTFSSAAILMKDTSTYFHWLFHANFVDNAIKGSVQAIFGMNRTKIECDALYCHYSYPSKVLQEVEASVSVERSLMVLVAYAVFSRVITFIFIKYRLKS